MTMHILERPFRLVLFTTLCCAGATLAGAGELRRGPYLQMATPDSIVVVWRTEGNSIPVVRYGNTPDALDKAVSGDAIVTRVSAGVFAPEGTPRLYQEPEEEAAKRDPRDHDPSTPPNIYQYEARITGLEADTTYYYAVYDDETKLAGGDESYHMTTSLPKGAETNMRIWVVGDSGTGGSLQKRVNDAMLAFVKDTERPLDSYIHVGDMAYGDGTDYQFQRNFFEVYDETLRNTVCWPSMGNHEGHTSRGINGFGPYYDAYVVPTAGEAGGVPSGTEAYYSYDIGSVHFICLDSHDLDRTPTGAMAQWLRADLEKVDSEWLIAFWHHPPYTKGSHDSDREGQLIEMRQHIMPILESSGVDLVLTGHSHIYERSMLIDGAYATPTVAEGVILDDGDGRPDGDGPYKKSEGLNPNEGNVQVVTGHGGASVGRSGTMPIMREIIVDHGSTILDLDGDTLVGTMIDKDGATRDIFSIVKEGRVQVSRVAEPWQPTHDLASVTEYYLDFIYDKAGNAPKDWAVATGDADSVVVDGSEGTSMRNVMAITAKKDAVVATYTEIEMDAFEFEARFKIDFGGAQEAGVVFGLIGPKDYYAVLFNGETGKARVEQVKQGKRHVIAEYDADVKANRWIDMQVETTAQGILLEVGDDLEFATPLEFHPPVGQLGVIVSPDGEAIYRDFEVERLEEAHEES